MALKDEIKLLRQEEVADLFRVEAKTIARWARLGKIDFVRTLGGHYRFNRDYIYGLLEGGELGEGNEYAQSSSAPMDAQTATSAHWSADELPRHSDSDSKGGTSAESGERKRDTG